MLWETGQLAVEPKRWIQPEGSERGKGSFNCSGRGVELEEVHFDVFFSRSACDECFLGVHWGYEDGLVGNGSGDVLQVLRDLQVQENMANNRRGDSR